MLGGRYVIEHLLGRGGMGVVYRARDLTGSAPVALKTLRKFGGEALYHFKREFRGLADLSHPNLIQLGELIDDHGRWFFTMELVEGANFLTHVQSAAESAAGYDATVTAPTGESHGFPTGNGVASTGRRLDPTAQAVPASPPARSRIGKSYDEGRLRTALGQMVHGLFALHAAGKVHRDVKPSNVLVSTEGRVILVDFGLSLDQADFNREDSQQLAGTPVYMAPEQAACRPVGPSADWYGVGTMLYEILAGEPPFRGTSQQILRQKQERVPELPRTHGAHDLVELCMALLEVDPEKRPGGTELLRFFGVSEPVSAALFPLGASFVGRQGELETLERALHQSRTTGTVVILRGESGMGKSALARSFTSMIGEGHPDTWVLTSRCYERESIGYKAWDGIIDVLTRHLMRLDPDHLARLLPGEPDLIALTRIFPVLRRIPLISRTPQQLEPRAPELSAPELRRRGFRALRELFVRLGEAFSLALVIDDLQWADADSLLLLRELVAPPEHPRLLIVATLRQAELSLPGTISWIDVGPLPVDEARALAQSFGCRVSPDRIATEARGSPLFIRELASYSGPTDEGVLKLEEVLQHRISLLDGEAQELLELISLAGSPIATEILAAAAARSPGATRESLARFRREHMVRTSERGSETVEPYHDRVQQAVLTRLSNDGRRRRHGALAQALLEGGAAAWDPASLVRHFLGAGDAPQGVAHAVSAAKRALQVLAFDRAAELYQLALDHGGAGHPDRLDHQLSLAEALAHAGRGPEAAEAFLAAYRITGDGASHDELRVRCRIEAARHYLSTGYLDQGLELLKSVLADVGERLPRGPRRSIASLVWHRAVIRLRGLGWRERSLDALSSMERLRLEALDAGTICLAPIDSVRSSALSVKSLRCALAAGARMHLVRALGREACFLAGFGGPREVRRALGLIDVIRGMGGEGGEREIEVWIPHTQGNVNLLRGAFREGARDLGLATTLWCEKAPHRPAELSLCRSFWIYSLVQQGSIAQLRAELPQQLRDAGRRGDRYTEATLVRMANVLWLADDDAETARRHLADRIWAPPDGSYHVQHLYELIAEVEQALYLGEVALGAFHARFTALSRSLLHRIRIVNVRTLWLRGRQALAGAAALPEGSSERRPALVEVAGLARRLRRDESTSARVYSALLEAGRNALGGTAGDAVAALRVAAFEAERGGLELHRAVALDRLGGLIGGDEGRTLRARSALFFAQEGIRRPESMMRVYAPGLASN